MTCCLARLCGPVIYNLRRIVVAILDFETKNLSSDLIAGAVTGLIAIPDVIASTFLAGTNPTYVSNALMTGALVGSLFTGSQLTEKQETQE